MDFLGRLTIGNYPNWLNESETDPSIPDDDEYYKILQMNETDVMTQSQVSLMPLVKVNPKISPSKQIKRWIPRQ